MKAIILSAGQGRRLLPLTESAPKCAVDLHGRSLLDWQLDQLLACGVDEVVVVTGFGAERVDALLARRQDRVPVRIMYNPFFEVADNLASCWLVRAEMDRDFLLLNGDTLFEPAVLRRLLESPLRPVTLAVDHKAHYDDDDMKVQLEDERLLAVGKDLPPQRVDGESIGLMSFRGQGPALFSAALEAAVRSPRGLKQWYLSVVGELAGQGRVWTCSVQGLDWAEVDYPLDLARASKMVAGWIAADAEAVNPGVVG
jgi:choline kinase